MALIYPTLSGLLVRMAASLQRLRSFRRPLTISVFMNPMGQRYGMERADGKRFRGMWSKARHFWHVFGVLSTFPCISERFSLRKVRVGSAGKRT